MNETSGASDRAEAGIRQVVGDTDPRTLAGRLPETAVRDGDGGFWVFAYGSLMWRPGFPYQARRPAVLPGYARRFCIKSIEYRGTPEAPGLVLGLAAEAEAITHGVAYRVGPNDADEARDYIAARELITSVYTEQMAPVRFEEDGAEAKALIYVADPAHWQYAGALSVEAQAEIIAASHGPAGPNWEYLFNTVQHLREAGLEASRLDRLDEIEALVRERLAAAG